MAHQMSIIYSDEIYGAQLFSCWPFENAETFKGAAGATAETQRTASLALINQHETDGKIAATSNIANQKIYIWGGQDDEVTPV